MGRRITGRRFLVVLLWLIPIIAVGATFWRLMLPPAPREVSPPVEFFILRGIVKDEMTGQPLAGAEVLVGGFKVLTRSDGSYMILGVRPGAWTLKVLMEGYEAYEESITVRDDLTMNVVLAPPPPATITGKVTDEKTGLLISGATVTADGYKTTTGPDGVYSLSVKVGTYNLTVSMEGYEAFEESVTLDRDLTMNVALLPPPPPGPATITGKVTDEKTGLPVAGATVTVDGYRVTTGPDGVYLLSVKVGTYNLTVSMKGYETKTVSVDASEEKTYTVDMSIMSMLLPTMELKADPDLIITEVGRNGTTVVTAVLKKGDETPAVGITVHFNSSGLPGEFDSPTAITDENGVATVRWTYGGETVTGHMAVNIAASATIEGQLIDAEVWVSVSLPCSRCHG